MKFVNNSETMLNSNIRLMKSIVFIFTLITLFWYNGYSQTEFTIAVNFAEDIPDGTVVYLSSDVNERRPGLLYLDSMIVQEKRVNFQGSVDMIAWIFMKDSEYKVINLRTQPGEFDILWLPNEFHIFGTNVNTRINETMTLNEKMIQSRNTIDSDQELILKYLEWYSLPSFRNSLSREFFNYLSQENQQKLLDKQRNFYELVNIYQNEK